jgi:phospholipase C
MEKQYMETDSTPSSGLDTFKHVVVLMLENRSFDNLLGYLYDEHNLPEGKRFAGLNDCQIEMPVPEWAKDYDQHKTIKPQEAGDYHQPFPDPGEVYQHVNTQLFNVVDKKNCGKSAADMHHPYNLPHPEPVPPPMTGFVKDYVNTLNALATKEGKKFNDPDFDRYSAIMKCFKPDKVNVLSTLAREFAVFDHWYCSVPSQTWCNRAFWHAGTSGGRVANPPDSGSTFADIKAMLSWIKKVWSQETLFETMGEAGVSHAVYIDGPVALTSLVNGPFKRENVIREGEELAAFKADLANRTLPQYSFIEPRFLGKHNDQHPSSAEAGVLTVDGHTKLGTVLLGEHLIWDVYTALKNCEHYRDDTLLIITYDEHGGCFDHVAPPALDHSQRGGEKGFNFDRLGVRVPMVMVSAHLQKNTIINECYEHASFAKTMNEKWGMRNLTERVSRARSFGDIFSPEKRGDFPDICEPDISGASESHYEHDPLSELQRAMVIGAAISAVKKSKAIGVLAKAYKVKTVGEAKTFLADIKGHL